MTDREDKYNADSDDLDIFAIFSVLAKHAGKIMLVGLVGIVMMIGFYSSYKSKVAAARFFRYQMEIGLHFHGINDQKYPNGKNFNPSDIVSPDVLKIIYDKNKIDVVNFEQFVNAFSASYKTVRQVAQKIEPPLDEANKEKKKPKAVDEKIIEIINPSEIMIFMSVHAETESLKQLPHDILRSIIKDVPVVWSKKFKRQYMMLNIPNPLKVINFESLSQMEYGDIYQILSKNLELFINGVESIEERNIDLSNIRSEKHDLTLEEAFFYVQNNLARQLSAWYSVPQSFGIYKDEEKRRAFLDKSFFELAERSKILTITNDAIQQTLENIRNPQKSLSRPANSDKSGSDIEMKDGMPALDDSLLERIYKSGQANQNINVGYVQNLTDKYLEGIEAIAKLEFEISLMKSDMGNLSKAKSITKKKKNSLIKEIEAELAKLVAEYQKWISVCIEIADENIETESLKYGGIYTVVSPMARTYINPSSSKALRKSTVLIPGALITLFFFGYCISLVVRESFIKYKKEQGNA